ncbi:MAG: NADH-quinone oxidoreductase subunit L [Pseudomonadota bacterium]
MSIYVLIPFLPLLAALVLALFGRQLEGVGHRLVIPAIAVSFALSVSLFLDVRANGAMEITLYQLLDVGSLKVDVGFFVDQLTVLLLLLVTGVSSIVQIYASRYMISDARHSRFFALTALFTGAMTVLVMSSNLLLTFMFWEVMGLCSYLLVSHYGEREAAAKAATKVFLVNAVADVGLFIGIILTFVTFGTLNIQEILSLARSGTEIPTLSVTLITLCLFMGAMGKSAQVPTHAWLPLAMEAPTPVSALIHAATMVNAGPFLLARLSPVIVLSQSGMAVIATVGAVTALFASVVSLTQTDVKRTLAYSTISQLGFMTFLCGVGAFVAAIFHLLAHGFFKAFLFLSTGNVLASTHRRFELEEEKSHAPSQGLFLWALVLSVLPPLVVFSGAYRDLWLSQGFTTAAVALWVVGSCTVFFTAMYLFKGFTTVFGHGVSGVRAGSRVTPTPFSTRLLGGIAVVAGVAIALLLVIWRWFAEFLSPAVGGAPASPSSGLTLWVLVPIGVALLGWGVAYTRRDKAGVAGGAEWKKRLYVFFLNKGYFDEIYEVIIVRPTLGAARWMWAKIDRGIIDRLVLSMGAISLGVARRLGAIDMAVDRQVTNVGSGSVGLARRLGAIDIAVDRQVTRVGSGSVSLARWLGRNVDTAGISKTVDGLGKGVDASGQAARRIEPRTLQHNLLVVVLSLIAALTFFYWIAG